MDLIDERPTEQRGAGTFNGGITTRRFFGNTEISASIIGLKEKSIERFFKNITSYIAGR